MHRRTTPLVRCAVALLLAGCTPAGSGTVAGDVATIPVAKPVPLVLAVNEGEERVRRFGGVSSSFTIKVDGQNGGSRDFVMLYEDVPAGGVIPPHRHLLSDEILFLHSGSGTVQLGDREQQVSSGGTVFIPANTRITLRNTGTTTMSLVAVFARQGFERYLRETSALKGQPVIPLSPAELAAIRKGNEHHTVYEKR